MANQKQKAEVGEQDILRNVTSPLSWLFLLCMAAVVGAAVVWSFTGRLPETVTAYGILVPSDTAVYAIPSEYDGYVSAVYFNLSDKVYPGDRILDIETVTGETKSVYADQEGYIAEIICNEGSFVKSPDNYVVRIRPEAYGLDQMLVCYVSVKDFKKIRAGQSVEVSPKDESNTSVGHMEARVTNVGTRAENTESRNRVLGENNSMESLFTTQKGGIVAVVCTLGLDPNSSNGYYWTTARGRGEIVSDYSLWQVRITIKEIRPIEKLFAKLGDIWEED